MRAISQPVPGSGSDEGSIGDDPKRKTIHHHWIGSQSPSEKRPGPRVLPDKQRQKTEEDERLALQVPEIVRRSIIKEEIMEEMIREVSGKDETLLDYAQWLNSIEDRESGSERVLAAESDSVGIIKRICILNVK